MSRRQKPTSTRLFETLRHYELWDSVLPTRGLPLLPDNYFEKANGAPFFLGKTEKKQTKNELEMVNGLGFLEKHNARIPHFHIFARLPGLNGSVFLLPGD